MDASTVKSFCLEKSGETFHLKQSHQYYYQIQAQLHLTHTSYCDFVVWTQKVIHVERIFPDSDFWKINVESVKAFYIKGILPELLGKHFSRNTHRKQPPNQIY